MINYLKKKNLFDVSRDIVLHGAADFIENIEQKKIHVITVNQFQTVTLFLNEPSKKRKIKRKFFLVKISSIIFNFFRKIINNY